MIDHFEWLAPVYDRLMGWLLGPPDRELWARLLELPTGGSLLDAGGGTGRVSEALRPLVGQLVVADTAHKMLRRARDRDGIAAVRADAARLPFADAGFERIMVTDALHHFRDQRQVIRELARVLAPGGVFVIEDFDIRRPAAKALAMLEKLTLMGSRFREPEEIRDMLEQAGLTAEIRKSEGLAVFVVAKKSVSQ